MKMVVFLPARTYNSRSSSPLDPRDICPLSSEPAAKARGQCPAAQGAIRRGAAAMPSQPATLFSPLLCFWFVREREWELLLWLSNFQACLYLFASIDLYQKGSSLYLDSLPPCPPSAAGAPPPCVHAAPVVLARPNRAQLAILASWTNQRARARHVGGKADKQDQTLVHRSKPQQKRRKAPRRSCLAACEEHSRDDIGIRVLCRPCEGRATIRCFAGLPGVTS